MKKKVYPDGIVKISYPDGHIKTEYPNGVKRERDTMSYATVENLAFVYVIAEGED